MFASGGWDSLKERLDGFLPEGSSRSRFARGAFWSIAGTVIAQSLALASAVLVARIFDSRDLYGQLGMIRNTVLLFGVFAGLGLGMTATKHVAEFLRTDPARAGRVIRMSELAAFAAASVIALAFLVCARWIAVYTLQAPQLETELRIGCLIFFFEALNGAQLGALTGFEAFKTVAWLSFLRGVLTFPLMVGGAWLGMSHGETWALRGAVTALALSAAAGWVMNRIALRSLMRKSGVPAAAWREARSEMPILRDYALPAFLNIVVTVLGPWAASAILVNRSSTGYDKLGVFNAANHWQFPVTLMCTQLNAVLLPMLSSFQRERDGEGRSRQATEAVTLITVLGILPLVALLSCLAVPIMSLYGPKFTGYSWVFWAALFVAGVKSLGTVPGTLIQARGALWPALVINSAWAVLLLALVYVWADRGAESYANAFSISYALSGVAAAVYVAWAGFCPWSMLLRILFATACLAGFTYGIGAIESLAWRLAAVLLAAAIAAWAARRAWRDLRGMRHARESNLQRP